MIRAGQSVWWRWRRPARHAVLFSEPPQQRPVEFRASSAAIGQRRPWPVLAHELLRPRHPIDALHVVPRTDPIRPHIGCPRCRVHAKVLCSRPPDRRQAQVRVRGLDLGCRCGVDCVPTSVDAAADGLVLTVKRRRASNRGRNDDPRNGGGRPMWGVMRG